MYRVRLCLASIRLTDITACADVGREAITVSPTSFPLSIRPQGDVKCGAPFNAHTAAALLRLFLKLLNKLKRWSMIRACHRRRTCGHLIRVMTCLSRKSASNIVIVAYMLQLLRSTCN
jgi:hypothetical protein